jgi:hypothetical protein
MSLSFLDIINTCDNVRINQGTVSSTSSASPFDAEYLLPLHLTPAINSPIIGLLRPCVIDQLKRENIRSREESVQELWDLSLLSDTSRRPRVSFQSWLDTAALRTARMKELCERWRDTGVFSNVCGPSKWRAEFYPVYRDPLGPFDYPSGPEEVTNYAFEMERSACAIFGIVTYGVHMNLYKEVHAPGSPRDLMIWVPTRAKTKQT